MPASTTFLAATGVALVLVCAGCSDNPRTYSVTEGNVKVTWPTECPSNPLVREYTALEGSEWQGERLIVRVRDNDYCGGTLVRSMKTAVENGTLELSWRWALSEQGGVTACGCDHALQFEIANLPRADYRIRLNRQRPAANQGADAAAAQPPTPR